MKFLPFASTIFWKSWANRCVFVSLGCWTAFAGISATPADALAFIPTIVVLGAKYSLATGGFVLGLLGTVLRVVSQNFGTDDSGNQIVSAIGTAPAGSNPTPAVVVAIPTPKSPPSQPTTPAAVTPEAVKAAAVNP